MTLGENLQKLRREAGLSQEEVAGRLFVSRQSVSKWENGQAEPGVENLKALADLYGVTLDQLAGRLSQGEDEEAGPAFEVVDSGAREERAVSFYRNVFGARTATAIVLEMILLQGGIKIPFDWLAMLAGLFVRKVLMWGIVQVFLWLNVAINLVNLTLQPVLGAIGLLQTGIFLYLFFRPEVKAYFHMTERGNTL